MIMRACGFPPVRADMHARTMRRALICLRRLIAALACALALHAAAADAPSAQPSKNKSARSTQIDWQTSPLDLDLRGMNGERYAFRCPPGKPQPSRVVGSGPYTDDSSICTAAVHAGALHAKDGGDVTIEIRPGQSGYAGSERNYIRSGDHSDRWDGSFVVVGTADGISTKGGNP